MCFTLLYCGTRVSALFTLASCKTTDPQQSVAHSVLVFLSLYGYCDEMKCIVFCLQDAAKIPPPLLWLFCSFLGNRIEFQNEILPTYLVILCAQNAIIVSQLAYAVFYSYDNYSNAVL